jgi:hypothetical protein
MVGVGAMDLVQGVSVTNLMVAQQLLARHLILVRVVVAQLKQDSVPLMHLQEVMAVRVFHLR